MRASVCVWGGVDVGVDVGGCCWCCCKAPSAPPCTVDRRYRNPLYYDDDELMLNVLRCQLTY